MSKVEKMSIALTPPLADAVRVAVEGGDYASSSEVIREALRLWINERERRAAKLADLRAAIDEGLASGVSEHYRTSEEIIADGKRRLAGKRSA